MNRVFIYAVGIALVCSASVLFSQVRVGVLPFSAGSGVSEGDAATITDIFRSEIVSADSFTVLERGQMDAILTEQEFQLSGCTDAECAVEIGRLLNMEKMIYGSVSVLGSRYYIIVTLVDIQTAEVDESVRNTINSFDEIEYAMEALVLTLDGKEVPERETTGSTSEAPAFESWETVDADNNYETWGYDDEEPEEDDFELAPVRHFRFTYLGAMVEPYTHNFGEEGFIMQSPEESSTLLLGADWFSFNSKTRTLAGFSMLYQSLNPDTQILRVVGYTSLGVSIMLNHRPLAVNIGIDSRMALNTFVVPESEGWVLLSMDIGAKLYALANVIFFEMFSV